MTEPLVGQSDAAPLTAREQAFDGQIVTDWTDLTNVCNVVMAVHDEPRPARLTAEHYAAGVMEELRLANAGIQDDYPWRWGVVPGGPYG